MKRLRVLAGVVLALLLVIVAIPFLVSADRFRPLIQDQLQAATGRPVEFGQLNLRLFPLSLRAHGLRIPGLLTAELVAVRVHALPLLRGDVEVESVALTSPIVEYDARTPATPSSGSTAIPASLTAVDIVDGQLVYTNSAGETSRYTHIDADIRADGPRTHGSLSWKNETLPVDLDFIAANKSGVWDVTELDAKLGAITAHFTGQIDANASTVNGSLSVKPTPLAGLPLKSAYKPTGTVTAEVKVAGPLKEPALTGAVQIADLVVTGGKLTQPLRATALELALTPLQIAAKPFSLQAGPTIVQADFRLTNYKNIDANLSTVDANIQDLLAIARMDDVTGTGSATLRVHAAGSLENPQLTGTGSVTGADLRIDALQPNLKIDTAQIRFEADSAQVENASFHLGKSNWKGGIRFRNFRKPQIAFSLAADQLSNVEMQSWFPPSKGGESKPLTVTGDIAVGKMLVNDLTLENLKSGLSLKDKLLTLEPLSASVYGGRLTGSATVNLKADPPVFQMKTHLDKVESEQLLAATTPLRKVVTGPLTAEADLQFAPKPGEDFAKTLDGVVQFQLAQGKLVPFNLLGEVGALAKFLKPLNNAASNTPFLGMKGAFNLKNGAAETNDLRLELDRAAAVITGSLNLVDQSLNLRMLTTLNKQLSEEVGGSKIGGILSAAMASPKGELLMPSLVRGTLSKPVFAPDAAAVAKLKLNPTGNLQEGVQGILDLFKGKQQQP